MKINSISFHATWDNLNGMWAIRDLTCTISPTSPTSRSWIHPACDLSCWPCWRRSCSWSWSLSNATRRRRGKIWTNGVNVGEPLNTVKHKNTTGTMSCRQIPMSIGQNEAFAIHCRAEDGWNMGKWEDDGRWNKLVIAPLFRSFQNAAKKFICASSSEESITTSSLCGFARATRPCTVDNWKMTSNLKGWLH